GTCLACAVCAASSSRVRCNASSGVGLRRGRLERGDAGLAEPVSAAALVRVSLAAALREACTAAVFFDAGALGVAVLPVPVFLGVVFSAMAFFAGALFTVAFGVATLPAAAFFAASFLVAVFFAA